MQAEIEDAIEGAYGRRHRGRSKGYASGGHGAYRRMQSYKVHTIKLNISITVRTKIAIGWSNCGHSGTDKNNSLTNSECRTAQSNLQGWSLSNLGAAASCGSDLREL